ncbi:hypothetical protein ACIA7S_28430 [Streptomyces sp. NPDC051643]|uniref:hypothetical protein n=1 Tax=Streptomyces sp. NPDC051643 TaxID=3365665 RepID=UPI00378F6F53
MSTTKPTAEQVLELHQFIQDRTEEEWQTALADENLSDSFLEAIRRLSNSNKQALSGTTAYLISEIREWGGGSAQATRLWDSLTTCGEQWQEHPDWRATEWENPARAALR